MLRAAGIPWPEGFTDNATWRKSKPVDKGLWVSLVDSIYGLYQKRVLEVRDYQYAFGGFNRRFNLWLKGQRERAWILDSPMPKAAVCVKTDLCYRFHVWQLLMQGGSSDLDACKVVTKALDISHSLQTWAVIALVANQKSLVQSMERAGFHLHRTLLQMVLDL
jgi:hypothetical protein